MGKTVYLDEICQLFQRRFEPDTNVIIRKCGNEDFKFEYEWIDRCNISSVMYFFQGKKYSASWDGKMLFKNNPESGEKCLVAYFGQDEDVTIPDDVTVIGKKAFDVDKYIRSVHIPDSVTEIGECAFSYCKSLENVSFPESLRKIDDRAFEGCGMVNLEFPKSLEDIGFEAFSECHRLKTVTFPEGSIIRYLRTAVFADCEHLSDIKFPQSLIEIDNRCFRGCTNLKKVYLPAGIKKLMPCMPYVEEVYISSVPEGRSLINAVANMGAKTSYTWSVIYNGCRFVLPRSIGTSGAGRAMEMIRTPQDKTLVTAYSLSEIMLDRRLAAYETWRKYHDPKARNYIRKCGCELVRHIGWQYRKDSLLELLDTYAEAGIITTDMLVAAKEHADRNSWTDVTARVLDLMEITGRPEISFTL